MIPESTVEPWADSSLKRLILCQDRQHFSDIRWISRGRLDDEIKLGLDIAFAVVEAVSRIGKAGAAVSRLKHDRVVAQCDANASCGEVDMLDRAVRMGRERTRDSARRHGTAKE